MPIQKLPTCCDVKEYILYAQGGDIALYRVLLSSSTGQSISQQST